MDKIVIKNPRIKHFNLSQVEYQQLYPESIVHPQAFFAKLAQRFIDWFSPWDETCHGSFSATPIQWFKNGQLNLAYNCLDRHLPTHKNHCAILWQGNEPSQQRSLSYQELYTEVCLMANVLKHLRIQTADVVCIYLPMIPEAIIAMLACARIGAIHNVVFGGFSSQALASRIQASNAKLIITVNTAWRGEKQLNFKEITDEALKHCPSIEHSLVIEHHPYPCAMQAPRDQFYHVLKNQVSPDCPPHPMRSQDPLFILYTSGSTGQPKGIVHSQGGYAVYVAASYYYLFNHQPNDIHWCSADVGWITGHSYTVYGPLLNAATTFIYESIPSYPDFNRVAQIIENHQIHHFYTAPTLIRLLRHHYPQGFPQYDLSSLSLLGSVGEPINPDVWLWFFKHIGKEKCPVVNTWWQTETGGIMLSPLPSDDFFIPGGAGKPFFGIKPYLAEDSSLYIQQPWPSLMQTIYQDHQRFHSSYLHNHKLGYHTGDSAYLDSSAGLQINGRVDDVIKISGHRFGSEELESALISHPAISEAAVISIPDAITGEAMLAFIVAKSGVKPTIELAHQIRQLVKQQIGPIAHLEHLVWVEDLPKTRSGKILRRLLKKIALSDHEFGDLSVLAEPKVIEQIMKHFQHKL